ncbi:MAG: phytanoyl-CoA dioxygenase family protein [Chloroflexota bacterium]
MAAKVVSSPELPKAAGATDVATYWETGVYVEPGVLTPGQCAALIQASHDFPSYQGGIMEPSNHPHRTHPLFLDVFRNRRIVSVMDILLSGPVNGLQTIMYYGKPGCRGQAAHQDNFYIQAPPGAFGSAWVALDEVTPENGGLSVYLGSHVEPLLEVQEIPGAVVLPGQDPNAQRLAVELPGAGYPLVDLPALPGSVIFIDGQVVHFSHPNRTTDRFRHSLLMTYLRKGETFRPGRSGRAEVDVY